MAARFDGVERESSADKILPSLMLGHRRGLNSPSPKNTALRAYRFFGLPPLALLSDLSGHTQESVVRRLERRIENEVARTDQRKLWASTYLLAGVRFPPEVAGKLLERAVAQMKESMTYQHILAEGRKEGIEQGMAQGERELFLRLARRRLGEPDSAVLRVVDQASSASLEAWADRLLSAESWQELLRGD